jgi:large subunit ribosomal protein L32
MGLPKRRLSKTRKRKRRTHWKLSTPGLTKCSHCSQPKTPHSVCPNCGFYAGREVVRIEEEL